MTDETAAGQAAFDSILREVMSQPLGTVKLELQAAVTAGMSGLDKKLDALSTVLKDHRTEDQRTRDELAGLIVEQRRIIQALRLAVIMLVILIVAAAAAGALAVLA